MTFTPTKELTAIMAENNISSSEIATWGTEFEAYVERFAQAFTTPEAYDAVGDGVTDDTTALQNALNGAAADGKILLIPAKTYITTGLSVPSGSRIMPVNSNSVIKRKAGTATQAVLLVSSKNDVVIGPITVDGNKAACTGLHSNIYATGSYNVTVNAKSVNSLLHCVSINGGLDLANDTYSKVTGAVVTGATSYGIEVQNSSRVSVKDNTVNNNGSHGIFVYSGTAYTYKDVQIEGNRVYENGASGISVPFVLGGDATTPGYEHVLCQGNIVENNAENGIKIQARHATVNGNTARNNGSLSSHQGILLNGISIIVDGNISANNAGVGIDAGDCYRIIISDNTVQENGIIGIEINSCDDFTCTGNMVSGNNVTTGAGSLAAGILCHLGSGSYTFVGDSAKGVISGNIVRSGTNQLYGISIEADTTTVRLVNNDALGAGSTSDYRIVATGDFIETGNVVNTPTVASASTVTLPAVGSTFVISGTTNIDTINLTGGALSAQKMIILRFTDSLTVNDSTGNLFISGNFSAVNGATLTLLAVSGGWVEVARS